MQWEHLPAQNRGLAWQSAPAPDVSGYSFAAALARGDCPLCEEQGSMQPLAQETPGHQAGATHGCTTCHSLLRIVV